MIKLLALKEIRILLAMPSTWLLLAGLQFILAWFFLANLDAFLALQTQMAKLANPPGATMMIAAPLFNVTALLLMMLTPMFTMRLIAEERRNHTFPLLLSAPIADYQIILGKFIGLSLLLFILSLSAPLMIWSLSHGTSLDHGLILSNMLGIGLLICSYVALGLYISALTASPITAAIGALAILSGLWLIDVTASDPDAPWHHLSLLYHFQPLNAGSINSNSLLFFILFTSACLILASRRLHNSRRYGE